MGNAGFRLFPVERFGQIRRDGAGLGPGSRLITREMRRILGNHGTVIWREENTRYSGAFRDTRLEFEAFGRSAAQDAAFRASQAQDQAHVLPTFPLLSHEIPRKFISRRCDGQVKVRGGRKTPNKA